MKPKGLGHTTRGVLGSVLLLAAGAWIFERTEVQATRPEPQFAEAASPVNAPVPAVRDGETIRVAVTRRAVRSVRLRVDGPYRVVPLNGAAATTFDRSLAEHAVTASAGELKIGGEVFADSDVEIVPTRSPSIWIDGRHYRGSIRLHVTEGGHLRPVNVLLLEEYLAAVVDSEMPAAFPPAARQAQAIVARTYAVSCRRSPPQAWFDLYSTPVSQNYLGFAYRDGGGRLLAGETAAGRAAVSETEGLICTHEGRLFRTYYSACCGGRTLSGEAVFGDRTPTLRGVPCDACVNAPLFRWERTIDDPAGIDDLARVARTRLPTFGTFRSAETISRSAAAPPGVALSDGSRTVRVAATEVKSALGLPSLLFDLSGGGDRLAVQGRGHGHSVGLCQWGAKGLAERGLTAEQILKRYYPGCELTRLR